jgi:hypothetical protein
VLKPWRKKCWCIPPYQSGEFVCQMEEVLEVYTRSYDPAIPLVCLDESSKQLISETRQPVPLGPGQPARYDAVYKREGVRQLFMIFEPLRGWRHVALRQHKAAVDWAEVIAEVLEVHYPHARRVCLVMDNLNTHAGGSLYQRFPPERARQLYQRLEIHYTPKHGSWLDMAEIELSVLAGQCLDRRIGAAEELQREVAAWEEQRNSIEAKVDWHFTTEAARIKLRKLYPTVNA